MNDRAHAARAVADAADGRRARQGDDPARVRALTAYPVAKATGMIKLDAMENPYALPRRVRARDRRARSPTCAINRYPDGAGDAVKTRAAPGVRAARATSALMLGNGSDEMIQMLTTAVAQPGAVVLAPEPSFVMYRLQCACYANLRFVGVPLRADFALDTDAMLEAIARERPALVWLAYPEQPDRQPVRRARRSSASSRAAPGLVVVDEAYYAFADDSFLPRVLEFANLVVVRTRVEGRAWRACGSATRSRIRHGSPSSTRCARRTTSTR